jgi:hypothetical protein
MHPTRHKGIGSTKRFLGRVMMSVRPSSPHLVILPEGRTTYVPGNLHLNALAGIFIV